MTQPKSTMPAPTARIVTVCPIPQSPPMIAAPAVVRCRDMMVDTAIT
jgi:hypothetical protein